MTLFMDGASHYSTSELSLKYAGVDSAACTWTVVAEGRTAGCIKRVSTSNASSGGLTITPLFTQAGVWSPTTSGIWGRALKLDDITKSAGGVGSPGNTGFGQGLLQIMSGNRNSLRIGVNPSGTFSLYRNTSTGSVTLLANSVQGLTSGVWAYVEVVWSLSTGSGGTCQIFVNGTAVLSFTGRTCPDASDMFPFTAVSPNWTSLIELALNSTPIAPLLTLRAGDCYVNDQVAPNGSRFGDITVAYILPDGVGNSSGWTPSAGANWQCVDEVPPNSDTDYVETTTAATQDLYTLQAVAGDPLAIQVCMFTRATSTGSAQIQPTFRISGANFQGNVQGVGSTSYGFKLQTYDQNPATSAVWTKVVLDAAESGPNKAA